VIEVPPVAVGLLGVGISGLVGVAILVVWICGLVDLMTRRPDLDGRHRAAWILIIVLFPFVGTLAYFFVRPTLPAEREEMIAAQQAIEGTPGRYGPVPRRT
jgi:hypothetical protein